MNDLERYLNQLCWAMGGSLAEQQAARDELRAHIEDDVRELELRGLGRADAMGEALHHLGDPEALGRRMRASRGTPALRRPLLQPEGAVLVSGRRQRHLPAVWLSLALAAAGGAAAFVGLTYLWPG